MSNYYNQNQPGYGAYPQAPVNGYRYAAPNQQQKRIRPVLTPEEMNELTSKGDFTLALTREQILRSICTHKDQNGNIVLYKDPTDPEGHKVICPICGASFPDLFGTEEDVRNAVEPVRDILQCIKAYYVDMTPEACREFFPVIAMLDKIPTLWKQAMVHFQNFEQMTNMVPNGQPYGFAAFNAAMGNAGWGPAYNPNQYAPGPVQYQQPPMMQQQPVYDPNQQYAGGGMMNPAFGYNGGNMFGGNYGPNGGPYQQPPMMQQQPVYDPNQQQMQQQPPQAQSAPMQQQQQPPQPQTSAPQSQNQPKQAQPGAGGSGVMVQASMSV